jgi:hypothetical protein
VSSDYRDRDTIVRLSAEMSDAQMAKHLGCSAPTIRYWRDRHGLPRSQARGSNIKYATDRGYFDRIDTPEKAYILGFIIADGSIHKNGKSIAIALKESDSALLLEIGRHLSCDAPLATKTSTGFTRSQTACLTLSGRHLVSSLAMLGVHHGKSRTATYPAIAPELERHLVRGLWDGDGWIGKRQFSLIGTRAVIAGVADAVERHTGCRLAHSLSNGHPRIQGSRRDRAAAQWMYADAPISLERKAEAFRLYWS